jgi:uncharacterized membrane protein YqjE
MALDPRRVGPTGPGLAESLRRAWASFLALAHSRFELFTRELELEVARGVRSLVLGFIALFFFGLGALTLTLFIIVLFWDSQRLVAIGFLTIVYFGLALALGFAAKAQLTRAGRPFARSVAQLKKDREGFSSSR